MADAASMGMFDGIESAKESRDSSYFQPGHYLVVINAVKADKDRKGTPYLAVECTVLHVYDNADDMGHSVMEDASWVIKTTQDSFLPNVKTFVSKLTGCDPKDVNKPSCVALCGPGQPLAGWFAEVRNKQITLKDSNPPKLWTTVAWKRALTNDQIKAIVDPEVLTRMFPDGLESEGEDAIPF